MVGLDFYLRPAGLGNTSAFFAREFLVDLLDFGCSLALEEVSCLLLDDLAVLLVVDLVAEGFDDCKDEVV